jgi:hypothetical protein
MSKLVGMSRNIKLEWLDHTASMVLSGKNETEIKESLNEYLSFSIKSPTNLRKTREILMNIWVRKAEEFQYIKELAITAYNENKQANKIAVHWCLMLITYPVYGDISEVIGKLEDKQYDITTSQIKSKMFDVWGERSTLLHSIDKNLRTMKDIGGLKSIKTGLYEIQKYQIKDEDIVALFVATILELKDKLYLSIDEVANSFVLFPFEYNLDLEFLQDIEFFSFDKFGGELVVGKSN